MRASFVSIGLALASIFGIASNAVYADTLSAYGKVVTSTASSNLMAYWSFDSDSGTSGSVCSSALGTVYNGTYSTTVDKTSSAYSSMGSALALDGSDSVSLPVTNLPTGSTSRTINIWFNTTAVAGSEWGAEQGLLEYGTRGSYNQDLVVYSAGNAGQLAASQWGGNLRTNSSYNDGRWHMLTLTIDSSKTSTAGVLWTFYLDGQSVVSNYLGTDTAIDSVYTDLILGMEHSATSGWIGAVDELSVWNTVLTDNQIATLHSAASVPEPNAMILLAAGFPGLLAYAWRNRRK